MCSTDAGMQIEASEAQFENAEIPKIESRETG
jgi:hypothetical protein